MNKIEEIYNYCKNKGGVCLESEYKTNGKYKCNCKNNHVFYLTWYMAKKRGSWCPRCSRNYIDPNEEIKEIHKYCEKHNGKCLENEYKRGKYKYKCECEKLHIFYLDWYAKKYWCPYCARVVVDKNEEMNKIHEYCKNKGGVCLEERYINSRHCYLCNCKDNHKFYLKWSIAKIKGQWCPYCSGHKMNPDKINDIKKYCEDKGGKCLDEIYKGAKFKYKCLCSKGHIFMLKWNNAVTQSSWCPKCSRNYIDPENEIKKIHKYCEDRGGVCLENKYKGVYYNYKCACIKNHNFVIFWNNSKRRGDWCPYCSGQIFDMNIELQNIHNYCLNRGGKCLDNEYNGVWHKYYCVCKNDHKFYLTWANAKARGDWCSRCSDSKFEMNVGVILRKITGHNFTRIKPDWLINPKTNCRLELDCYCKELNLAIECQGPQHYEIINKFGMTKESLENIKYRDEIKRIVCKEKGVKLIEIEYVDNINLLEKIIRDKLQNK